MNFIIVYLTDMPTILELFLPVCEFFILDAKDLMKLIRDSTTGPKQQSESTERLDCRLRML